MIPEANLWATVAPARGHFTVRSTLFGPKRSAQLRSGRTFSPMMTRVVLLIAAQH